jgi:hypothetical protein
MQFPATASAADPQFWKAEQADVDMHMEDTQKPTSMHLDGKPVKLPQNNANYMIHGKELHESLFKKTSTLKGTLLENRIQNFRLKLLNRAHQAFPRNTFESERGSRIVII